MMRSLFSGVSGLTSHQTKMDVIGNNIGNVNTYGFKGSSVSFSDLLYQTTGSATAGSATAGGINPSQIGYGTQVAAITKNMSRSSFQSTSSTLDLAIAGEGFFQVQDKAGNSYYTRAGNFTVDKAGNVVDSKGKFVLGTVNTDPTIAEGLSTAAGSEKITIKVPDVHKAAGDGAITMTVAGALVPPVAGTANYTLAFNNGDQINNMTITITNTTTADDSIVYTKAVAVGGTDTLVINIKDASNITTLENLQTKINGLIEAQKKEDNNGTLTADYKAGSISVGIDTTGVTSGALSSAQNAALQKDALTSIYAAGAKTLTSKAYEQSYSNLSSFTIGDNGVMVGVHPVHGSLTFGRVDVATFDNVNGLEEAGDSLFAATVASGDANLAVPGYDGSGAIVSSALEMSNVNLAQEFSDMIIAQRGFQANSRIITTSDSMLEELVNLKR